MKVCFRFLADWASSKRFVVVFWGSLWFCHLPCYEGGGVVVLFVVSWVALTVAVLIAEGAPQLEVSLIA